MKRDRLCCMCGGFRAGQLVTPFGPVCRNCVLVCVEVTMDRLAGALVRIEARDAMRAAT